MQTPWPVCCMVAYCSLLLQRQTAANKTPLNSISGSWDVSLVRVVGRDLIRVLSHGEVLAENEVFIPGVASIEQEDESVNIQVRQMVQDETCSKSPPPKLLFSGSGQRSALGLGGVVRVRFIGDHAIEVVGKISADGNTLRWSNKWQWSRSEPRNDSKIMNYIGESHVIHSCKRGTFMLNLYDSVVSRSLLRYGEWSEGELELFLQFIKPGDMVIDVGANIGAFTVPLAKAVTSTGLVYAFEPQMFLFQCLSANLVLNELTNVLTYPYILSNETGLEEIPRFQYFNYANFAAISFSDAATRGEYVGEEGALPPYRVRKETLDVLFPVDDCPTFLKVDVEGMEAEVIEGAQGLIMRCRPTLFLENNLRKTSKRLLEVVLSLHYVSYWVYVPYYNPHNFFQDRYNLFERNYRSINILCVPMESKVEVQGLIKIESGRWLFEEYNKELTAMGYQGFLNGQEE